MRIVVIVFSVWCVCSQTGYTIYDGGTEPDPQRKDRVYRTYSLHSAAVRRVCRNVPNEYKRGGETVPSGDGRAERARLARRSDAPLDPVVGCTGVHTLAQCLRLPSTSPARPGCAFLRYP